MTIDVTFFTKWEELPEAMPPVPATKFWPEWFKKQSEVQQASERAYRWAIDNNIAKEQARVVLPEGMTKTRLYMNGTIRSWVHYIELRGANGTQKEHLEIAHACAKIIAEIFPLIEDIQ